MIADELSKNDYAYVQMVLRLKKPGVEILGSLTPNKCDLLHMAIGITDEMREAQEAHEKLIDLNCIEFPEPGTLEKAREHLVEELGDCVFYLTGLSDSLLNYSKNIFDDNTKVFRYDLLDLVKKHVIYNKELDMVSVAQTFFSITGYVEFLAKINNIEFQEIVEYNMQKLGKRYGKVYTDEAAQARRDKVEGE